MVALEELVSRPTAVRTFEECDVSQFDSPHSLPSFAQRAFANGACRTVPERLQQLCCVVANRTTHTSTGWGEQPSMSLLEHPCTLPKLKKILDEQSKLDLNWIGNS